MMVDLLQQLRREDVCEAELPDHVWTTDSGKICLLPKSAMNARVSFRQSAATNPRDVETAAFDALASQARVAIARYQEEKMTENAPAVYRLGSVDFQNGTVSLLHPMTFKLAITASLDSCKGQGNLFIGQLVRHEPEANDSKIRPLFKDVVNAKAVSSAIKVPLEFDGYVKILVNCARAPVTKTDLCRLRAIKEKWEMHHVIILSMVPQLEMITVAKDVSLVEDSPLRVLVNDVQLPVLFSGRLPTPAYDISGTVVATPAVLDAVIGQRSFMPGCYLAPAGISVNPPYLRDYDISNEMWFITPKTEGGCSQMIKHGHYGWVLCSEFACLCLEGNSAAVFRNKILIYDLKLHC